MTKYMGAVTDQYIYDGDGQRVKKSASTVTLYWYDLGGNVLEETTSTGNLIADYVYFNGKRVARRDADTTVKYYFSDHLGSASVITNNLGAMPPLAESDYYPYGGEIQITSGDSNHYKFTGKERDADTCGTSGNCLDNFGARYYGSGLGRFMTPDWSERATAVPYAVFGDPQTLNLYTYVQNGPINRVDADGHIVVTDEEQGKNLLLNVKKDERKLFHWDKKSGLLTLDSKKLSKYKGDHSVGFSRLSTAVSNEHKMTLVTREVSEYAGTNAQISEANGGAVTVAFKNGDSVIEVSKFGNFANRFNPGTVEGKNGKRVPDPIHIIVGHEALGHGVANMIGEPNTEKDAIHIENELRREQGLDERKEPQ